MCSNVGGTCQNYISRTTKTNPCVCVYILIYSHPFFHCSVCIMDMQVFTSLPNSINREIQSRENSCIWLAPTLTNVIIREFCIKLFFPFFALCKHFANLLCSLKKAQLQCTADLQVSVCLWSPTCHFTQRKGIIFALWLKDVSCVFVPNHSKCQCNDMESKLKLGVCNYSKLVS